MIMSPMLACMYAQDYGQVAIYRGSIPECEHEYQLDVHHVFVANQPKLVCGNTATMLEEGWLAPHFHVQGDRSVSNPNALCNRRSLAPATTTACTYSA